MVDKNCGGPSLVSQGKRHPFIQPIKSFWPLIQLASILSHILGSCGPKSFGDENPRRFKGSVSSNILDAYSQVPFRPHCSRIGRSAFAISRGLEFTWIPGFRQNDEIGIVSPLLG
jgi:hypothetical protein